METLEKFAEQPITRTLILDVLKEYKRPYDKIHELTRQGLLQLVKRGVYIPGKNSNIKKPEPFLLANHLLGPSYISLESALSYYGMIPEKLFEVTSVTSVRAVLYKTPVGRFRYIKMALPYYAFGIVQIALTPEQHILIATPEKALCDKVITTPGLLLRSAKQAKEWLLEDLRMEPDQLKTLDTQKITSWIPDTPKSSSLKILVQTLKNL